MVQTLDDDFLVKLIELSIDEDAGQLGDITSQALIDEFATSTFVLRSRESGVLSGSQVVNKVISIIDDSLKVSWMKSDGDDLVPQDNIATISGNLRAILQSERVVLNFLSHLSGVATQTRMYVDKLHDSGSKTVLRDTRKTTPGFRSLEKAAVRHGGAQNHRMGLYDAFLIKDNHLSSVSIEEAIKKCRKFDETISIEVEVDSIEQLKQVSFLGPDLILLDNFDVSQVRQAIELVPEAKFEVSGGVNLENIVEYGLTNVDFIAVGALTHSVKSLDIGLDAI
jgi:nicotinate-nucleotide pyrophosphorylase (carboxylating)